MASNIGENEQLHEPVLLEEVIERLRPGDEDNWLLVPADHPALEAAVVRQLVEARAAHPERSVVIPTFGGRRGHPALIAWRHVAGIRGLPADVGLNVYLRQRAEETHELAVASDTVLLDLDTPEDMERLRWRMRPV